MRVNINKGINLNMLRMVIFNFKNTIEYSQSSFLIMSKETMNALIAEREYGCKGIQIVGSDDESYATFCEIPIAICNKLDFGEVNIK